MRNATAIIMSMVLARRQPPRPRRFLPRIPISISDRATLIRLKIHDGDLLTGSLTSAGFASGVHPDWAALPPLQLPKTKILQEH